MLGSAVGALVERMWYAVRTPDMPEPMMAMSHLGGRDAVERRSACGCGSLSQYEGTGLGTGRMGTLVCGVGEGGCASGPACWMVILIFQSSNGEEAGMYTGNINMFKGLCIQVLPRIVDRLYKHLK
jgi:hypothetical protein